MNKYTAFFISVVIVAVVELQAQESFSSRYNINYITMENGLLHNFIDDIYKDSRGFLWISTAGGLSRYDGYEFLHYNSGHPHAKIKGNFVTSVMEDDFHRLWILSDGGTQVLDLKTDRLIELNNHEKLKNILNQPGIRVIKDSQGCIWICTVSSINRITFKDDGEIDWVNSLSPDNITIQLVALSDIDNDGNIWLGLKNKVYKLYPADNEALRAEEVSPLLRLNEWVYVTVFLLKENEIWIGTNDGLVRYNRNEEITKYYVHDRNRPRSLTQNYITDLTITSDKQLLVSTLRGLNIYNPIRDNFEHLNYYFNIPKNGLNSDFINCTLIDDDIIWIGSESGGINKLTPRKLSVNSYVRDNNDPGSLSWNLINAIYEDSKGNLWVGTVEGGLNKKNNNNSFSHYTTQTTPRLIHNTVSAIIEDEYKNLWVGSWGRGITVLDLEKPGFPVKKYITPEEYPEARTEFIGAMCYDSLNKGVWIGTNPGVYFFDINSDTIIIPLPEEINNSITGTIGSIIDKDNKLWVGSMEGVYVIDLTSRNRNNKFSFEHLKFKLDDPLSGLQERSSCFYIDSRGTLWIGSDGYGIYKHQPESANGNRFTVYDNSHGLINNNVRGILEDEQGNLWISTINGLSCLDVSTGRFTNYTIEDGIIGNQFYWNAFCRSRDGILYFGGIDGLTAVEGKREIPEVRKTNITLTKLRVANEIIYPGNSYITEDIATAKTLTLHESDKSFSLEFSALDFEKQLTANYGYRLVGFDDEWVEVPANRRFASYTNIPPGKYKFQVKYLSNENNFNTPVKELNITVIPYFYKTVWFILLVIISLLTGVYYFYKRHISKIQHQQEILSNKVEERTTELKQQKIILENQKEELSQQNEILIRQNEKITKQKTQLVFMSKKVKELTQDRISFFTNITHEFRTPITLIIGPIERALKLSYNPQVIEQLNFVERNSKYLLSLVNQLMDFRKVEAGKMEIYKRDGDFMQFINAIIMPFEVFAQERNITIETYFRVKDPFFKFDPEAMQKVLTNLISNAIKFTPDNGQIRLYVASVYDTGIEKLYISIQDTGIGIIEEDINKIFDRFYQSRNNVKFPIYGQSGTGIGLYLSQRIINLHQGTIKALNNKKEGSNFRILLPIERSILKNTEENGRDIRTLPVVGNKALNESDFVPGNLTLLIVEDNKDMRGYIRSILKDKFNILEAEHGAAAYEILLSTNIDFIICDLMMPVMDGLELSRKVKENFALSHIPFLMLTAKTSPESRLESYRIGVDAYLLKPFSEELLLARIDSILGNRKRYQHQFIANMDVEVLHIEEESSDKKFINKSLDILKENYFNSAFDVGNFIESMGMSKSILNKKLQSLTGQSIGQFIRNYRLNIARELIEKNRLTKNKNISEIAYEVGFNDPKYFTRCFTKRFMVTPSSLLDD